MRLNADCISRRQFLARGSAWTVAPVLTQTAGPSVAAPSDFEDRIAAHVRALIPPGGAALRMLLPTGCGASVGPVARVFTEMTGVPISFQEVRPTGVNAALLLDTMTNSQRYDVALPATFGLSDLADAGAIRPVDDYAKKYEPVGFRDGLVYDLGDRVSENLYGYQTDGDAYLMFYNRKMMRDQRTQDRYAAAFDMPLAVPTTWAELDRQMAFFHQPDAGVSGGLLFRSQGFAAWEWWVRFHAKGFWPFNLEMSPQIAQDAGVEALEDMIRSQAHLDPKSRSVGLVENWKVFDQGNIYCNIGWGGTQKHLNRVGGPMRGQLEYGPTPGGIVSGELLRTPYFNWGWNYVVTQASPQPELAYLFALFASGPRMSTMAVSQPDSFFDPFRSEHYTDPQIKSAYSPAFLEVQRAALLGAIPDLYLSGQADYFRELNEGIMRALSGQNDAQTALTQVAQLWELITSRFGRQDQIVRWAELRAQYPPQAQRLLKMIGSG